KLKSIAFPAISTGIFGCPKPWAASVMLKAAIDYLKEKTGLEKVIFCLYSEDDFKLWCKVLEEMNV
ncbi:MAG TPA: O-acetyl-ADP-ribose deacetylase, partial [Candidatus Desulfofervidus auxilii]|nr:O-acetyl-ADP-ribose deacetylase [Candidatus Desulfofervidus auxilii]